MMMKGKMSIKELAIFEQEFNKKKKGKGTAYLLWFFLGTVGAHRFYLGDIGKGLLLLFTLGGLFIGAIVDVFFIGSRVESRNEEIELNILNNMGIKCQEESEESTTKTDEISKEVIEK